MRSTLYGSNEIIVPLENIFVLFIKEILSPFYVFQVFSITFWYVDNYDIYASIILISSIFSIASALYQTRTSQRKLRDTIVSSGFIDRKDAKGSIQPVRTSELVPGDIIALPDSGGQLLCDAVVLEGQVILDEGMLTGESVPIIKTQ